MRIATLPLRPTNFLLISAGHRLASHRLASHRLVSHRLRAAAKHRRADADAARHGGVYRTVVSDRPMPFECDLVRLSWPQCPGVELPVKGRHSVRVSALVDPRDRGAWFDGNLCWGEVEVLDVHGSRRLQTRRSCARGDEHHEHEGERAEVD